MLIFQGIHGLFKDDFVNMFLSSYASSQWKKKNDKAHLENLTVTQCHMYSKLKYRAEIAFRIMSNCEQWDQM